MTTKTVQQLRDRLEQLEAERAEIKAEIASRHGEVDPEPKPAAKPKGAPGPKG